MAIHRHKAELTHMRDRGTLLNVSCDDEHEAVPVKAALVGTKSTSPQAVRSAHPSIQQEPQLLYPHLLLCGTLKTLSQTQTWDRNFIGTSFLSS